MPFWEDQKIEGVQAPSRSGEEAELRVAAPFQVCGLPSSAPHTLKLPTTTATCVCMCWKLGLKCRNLGAGKTFKLWQTVGGDRRLGTQPWEAGPACCPLAGPLPRSGVLPHLGLLKLY